MKEDKIFKPTIEVTNVISDNMVQKETSEVEEVSHTGHSEEDF